MTTKTFPPERIFTPKQEMSLRDIAEFAPSKLSLFRRVYSLRASPRQAIKAKCLECVGMDSAAITSCTASSCPLWALRPFQGGHV